MPLPLSAIGGTLQPLSEALEKNKLATETVKQVAEELAVIHEVLGASLPEQVQSEDVGQAVEKASDAEKRLNQSAERLEEVNEALAKHITPADEANIAR